MGPVLEDSRLDRELWYTFLVYLTCSPRPAAEMLAPAEPRDFTSLFAAHFQGMTTDEISIGALLDIRRQLLRRVAELLDDASCQFLMSVEQEAPDFDLIGLPEAATLPAVRRKMHNLSQRTDKKRKADRNILQQTLERIRSAKAAHKGTT